MYYNMDRLPNEIGQFLRRYLLDHNYTPGFLKPLTDRPNYDMSSAVMWRELALRINQFELYEAEVIKKILKNRKIKKSQSLATPYETDLNNSMPYDESSNIKDTPEVKNITYTEQEPLEDEHDSIEDIKEDEFYEFLDKKVKSYESYDPIFTSKESKSNFISSVNTVFKRMLNWNSVCMINEIINTHIYFGDLFGALDKLRCCENTIAHSKKLRGLMKLNRGYLHIEKAKLCLHLEIVMRLIRKRDESKSQESKTQNEQENSFKKDVAEKENIENEEMDREIGRKIRKNEYHTIKDEAKINDLLKGLPEIFERRDFASELSQFGGCLNNKNEFYKRESYKEIVFIDEFEKYSKNFEIKDTKRERKAFKNFKRKERALEKYKMDQDCEEIDKLVNTITLQTKIPEEYYFSSENPLFRYFKFRILNILRKAWNMNLFEILLDLLKYTYKVEEVTPELFIIQDLEITLKKLGIFSTEYLIENVTGDDLKKLYKLFKYNKRLQIITRYKNNRLNKYSINHRYTKFEYEFIRKTLEKRYNKKWYDLFSENTCSTSLMKLIKQKNEDEKDDRSPLIFKRRVGYSKWKNAYLDLDEKPINGNASRFLKIDYEVRKIAREREYSRIRQQKNVGIFYIEPKATRKKKKNYLQWFD